MIAPWASRFVGIPHEYAKSSRESADCYGLLRLVYREVFAIEIPDLEEQLRAVDKDAAKIREMVEHDSASWIEVVEPEIGDAVVLNFCGRPTHVAVYVGDKRILTTTPRHSSVIDDLRSFRWKNKVEAYYRHPMLSA